MYTNVFTKVYGEFGDAFGVTQRFATSFVPVIILLIGDILGLEEASLSIQ